MNSTQQDKTTAPDPKESKRKFLSKASLILIGICIPFGVLFALTYVVDEAEVLREPSLAIFAATLVSFIVEMLLRIYFIDVFRKETQQQVREVSQYVQTRLTDMGNDFKAELKTQLDLNSKDIKKVFGEIIEEKMPGSYRRLRDVGIVDAYKNIHDEVLKDSIFKKMFSTDSAKVVLHGIWAPYMEQMVDENFVEAIKFRKAEFHFLLVNPRNTDGLAKRQYALGNNVINIAGEIHRSLEKLHRIGKMILNECDEETLNKHFKIRLHSCFISTPLVGLNDVFVIGFYLFGERASFSPQVKVVKDTGKPLYRKIANHCNSQWMDVQNEIVYFEKGQLMYRPFNLETDYIPIFGESELSRMPVHQMNQ